MGPGVKDGKPGEYQPPDDQAAQQRRQVDVARGQLLGQQQMRHAYHQDDAELHVALRLRCVDRLRQDQHDGYRRQLPVGTLGQDAPCGPVAGEGQRH